jgi:hypothetical protein
VGAAPERVAQVLGQREAGEAQPALVDEGHVPLRVGHPHQHRRRVGELAELGLGVAHRLLVAGTLGRRADHVGDRLEEVRVVGSEVLGGAAVHADAAELAPPGADLGHDRADDAQVALDRRRVEADLAAEVVDDHGPRVLERVPGQLVRLRRYHAAHHALGQARPRPDDQAQPVCGQLQH